MSEAQRLGGLELGLHGNVQLAIFWTTLTNVVDRWV